MDRPQDDGSGSPRIDVRSLPDSVARLWETMLRLDPSWDLSEWLDKCATDELELVEGHLGRERLRLEQRLHRIETLVKRLRRQREVAERPTWTDPNQRNLFDVYEKDVSDAVPAMMMRAQPLSITVHLILMMIPYWQSWLNMS